MKCYWFPPVAARHKSPSIRREWIEIRYTSGVGRCRRSPSIRREWIEMLMPKSRLMLSQSLPPYGGSGLKLITQSIDNLDRRSLPPYGGSGLK